jgi:hypothetical protein
MGHVTVLQDNPDPSVIIEYVHGVLKFTQDMFSCPLKLFLTRTSFIVNLTSNSYQYVIPSFFDLFEKE